MTVLVNIRSGLTLEALAAASWARMEAVRGRPLDVNRSTVSRANQMIQYEKWVAYQNGGPWAPLALHPDKSWHCEPRARAVDTDDDVWIRANPDYGWRFVVPSEKWHAQYYPEHDKHKGDTAGGGSKPFPPADITEGNIMDWVIVSYSGGGQRNGIVLASPGHWRKLSAEDWEVLNTMKRADGKPFLDGVPTTTPYNDRAYDVFRSVYVNTAD